MVEQLNTANHNHYPYILYFSVPDDFKTIWTRKNGLLWKEVTTTYICLAHFESKCFSARKRINFETAVIVSPAEDAAHTNALGEHDYAAAAPDTEVADVDQAAATTAQSQVAADHDYAAGNLDTEVAAAQTVQRFTCFFVKLFLYI